MRGETEGYPMPLLDHFHPPSDTQHPWDRVFPAWTEAIARRLNAQGLPEYHHAAAQVDLHVEADVVAFQGPKPQAPPSIAGAWPPPPDHSFIMPAWCRDEIDVQILKSEGGYTLVGIIKMVSPGHKETVETRRSFATQCSTYLDRGIGLVLIDVVASHAGNIHDEIIDLRGFPAEYRFAGIPDLYVASYRPVRRKSGDHIEIWPTALAIGAPMPTVPLPIRNEPTRPLDLEGTYAEALSG